MATACRPVRRGELLVRGASVFPGYWNRPDAHSPGIFGRRLVSHPGDVAYLDQEGFLFIVDRIKDLIIRGGENVRSGQVEAALLMHPGVHECAVYRVPDERMGEEVGAGVYGSPDLDPQELQTFLAGRLARFEIPRHLVISRPPAPHALGGKLLEREIRLAALALLGLESNPRVTGRCDQERDRSGIPTATPDDRGQRTPSPAGLSMVRLRQPSCGLPCRF
jgi:long-chain acyl-CoA synthetase